MTNFNPTLTIEEATALFHFKGKAMWPDTQHNRETMAAVALSHLKSLQSKKS